MSSNFQFSSSSSFTSTSTSSNGQTTSQSASHSSYTDPSGTRVHTSHQSGGNPAVQQTSYYAPNGSRQVENGGSSGRIEDVTDREEKLSKEEVDRLYEERMEEEYAKREGGA